MYSSSVQVRECVRKARGLEEDTTPWALEIREIDVQCGINQWLCCLLAERYCLNVTALETRSERVCLRCLGVPKAEDAAGNAPRTDILCAAILV